MGDTSGWWYTYPSEKHESQLGLLFPIYIYIYMEKNVPNHQQYIYIYNQYVYIYISIHNLWISTDSGLHVGMISMKATILT